VNQPNGKIKVASESKRVSESSRKILRKPFQRKVDSTLIYYIKKIQYEHLYYIFTRSPSPGVSSFGFSLTSEIITGILCFCTVEDSRFCNKEKII
jgi:hypothetical protein